MREFTCKKFFKVQVPKLQPCLAVSKSPPASPEPLGPRRPQETRADPCPAGFDSRMKYLVRPRAEFCAKDARRRHMRAHQSF